MADGTSDSGEEDEEGNEKGGVGGSSIEGRSDTLGDGESSSSEGWSPEVLCTAAWASQQRARCGVAHAAAANLGL